MWKLSAAMVLAVGVLCGQQPVRQTDFVGDCALAAKSAAAGSPQGQARLGLCKWYGRGAITIDRVQSCALFKQAAGKGDPLGLWGLGFCYRTGGGSYPVNLIEAAKLFKAAVAKGNPTAHASLGTFYLNGQGGCPEDHEEAKRLYRISVEAGDPLGQLNMGALYERGRGGEVVDLNKAVSYYQKAANQQHPNAQYFLGVAYSKGLGGLGKNPTRAVALWEASAKQGYSWALIELAVAHAQGTYGVPVNPQRTVSLLQRAVAFNIPEAKARLGLAYCNGFGVKRDDARCMALIREAAAQGDELGIKWKSDLELMQQRQQAQSRTNALEEWEQQRDFAIAVLERAGPRDTKRDQMMIRESEMQQARNAGIDVDRDALLRRSRAGVKICGAKGLCMGGNADGAANQEGDLFNAPAPGRLSSEVFFRMQMEVERQVQLLDVAVQAAQKAIGLSGSHRATVTKQLVDAFKNYGWHEIAESFR